MDKAKFDAALVDWLKDCQRLLTDYFERRLPNLPVPTLRLEPGRKFVRVVREDPRSQAGHVPLMKCWAFIDSTNGDILMPASWARPAPKARGNLFDAHLGLGQIDHHGPKYLR